jgi:hypothetical protein
LFSENRNNTPLLQLPQHKSKEEWQEKNKKQNYMSLSCKRQFIGNHALDYHNRSSRYRKSVVGFSQVRQGDETKFKYKGKTDEIQGVTFTKNGYSFILFFLLKDNSGFDL